MKGTDNWSVGAGIVMTIAGAILLIVSFFAWPVIFYAVPILVIGLVILFTLKEQEHIEPIKSKGSRKIEVNKRNKRGKR